VERANAWKQFLGTKTQNCRGKGNIPVEAKGDPDARTIYNKVVSNETEHYTDLVALSTLHLGALLTRLRSFSDKTATNDDDCQQKFNAFSDRKSAEAILAFLNAVKAKVAGRDVRLGPHHFVNRLGIAEDCSQVNIVVKPSA